jgi:HAD superfamily hydrolase (TIGR01549 family)
VDWQQSMIRDNEGRYDAGVVLAPADLRRVRAISFDLDNTLWEIQPVIERAERELHAFLNERYPAMVTDMPLSVLTELRQRVATTHPHKAHDFTWLRKETLREQALYAKFSTEAAVRIAEEAFDRFYRYRNVVRLYDDVIPALDWLRERYQLMTISNGNADLQAIGLAHYFASSVWAREVGTLKPGALMFLRPLMDVQLDPEQVLHVGDDPLMDVEGARAVGYQTAWLDRFETAWPESIRRAHYEFTNLSQLVEQLSAALADVGSMRV